MTGTRHLRLLAAFLAVACSPDRHSLTGMSSSTPVEVEGDGGGQLTGWRLAVLPAMGDEERDADAVEYPVEMDVFDDRDDSVRLNSLGGLISGSSAGFTPLREAAG
ncbi:hypothetical protein ATO4_08280 [Aurantimonas sp. 22II-16-19i]|nr:hypothetical protein ATO4_08280 [Aurantimonas sp. 22II-16-19i]